jgi:hypothetical protein
MNACRKKGKKRIAADRRKVGRAEPRGGMFVCDSPQMHEARRFLSERRVTLGDLYCSSEWRVNRWNLCDGLQLVVIRGRRDGWVMTATDYRAYRRGKLELPRS